MSFRDDHDAALARAEALEEELARTKAEKERLERENAELRKPKPDREPPKPKAKEKKEKTKKRVPRPETFAERERELAMGNELEPASPSGEEREARFGKYLGGALAVVIGGLVVVPGIVDCRQQAAYKAERAAWETDRARWQALLRVDECLRAVTRGLAELAHYDAGRADPRSGQGGFRAPSELRSPCTKHLDTVSEIPALAKAGESPTPKDSLVRWRRAEAGLAGPLSYLATYYEQGDWKDDNYAAAARLWAAVKPAAAELQGAVNEAWTVAQPAVRAEIRRIQAEYLRQHGETPAWWRIELGHLYQDLANLDARDPTSAERRVLAGKLRARIKDAPLDVRRDLRSTSESLEQIEAGEWRTSSVSGYGLWDRVDEVGEGPIPKEPQPPQSCGGDG